MATFIAEIRVSNFVCIAPKDFFMENGLWGKYISCKKELEIPKPSLQQNKSAESIKNYCMTVCPIKSSIGQEKEGNSRFLNRLWYLSGALKNKSNYIKFECMWSHGPNSYKESFINHVDMAGPGREGLPNVHITATINSVLQSGTLMYFLSRIVFEFLPFFY